jgi:hypothetical protein
MARGSHWSPAFAGATATCVRSCKFNYLRTYLSAYGDRGRHGDLRFHRKSESLWYRREQRVVDETVSNATAWRSAVALDIAGLRPDDGYHLPFPFSSAGPRMMRQSATMVPLPFS